MWWTQPQTPLHGLARSAFQPSHCFQLNQLLCKHVGNWWVFLFSCRSRVLNNIQKDSATYLPMLAKIWSPSLPSPPSLSNIFPSTFWEEHMRMKRNRYTMVQSWRSLADGHWKEETEKRVSMEQGGQRPPFRRLQEEIFQIQWPAMPPKAQAVMWHMTYSAWYVLADPNALISASAFWS